MAVFFVVFVFVDLAFPQLCREAVGSPPASVHAPVSADSGGPDSSERAAAVTDSDDSRGGQQPDQAPHEEDCLGCCGHVLPGSDFPGFGAAEMVSLPTPAGDDGTPTPSLRNPYHPPRIS